jgi:hypothetical protein
MTATDWRTTSPSDAAAAHFRGWANQRIAELEAKDFDKAREALLRASWRIGVDLTGVPDVVRHEFARYVQTAQSALGQQPVARRTAKQALQRACRLVAPHQPGRKDP